MTIRRIASRTFCALVAVLGLVVTAPPALAQTRAAVTRDVDAADLAPFTFYVQVDNTFKISDLPFTVMAAVPAGKRLVIDHVSYYSYGNTTNALNTISLFALQDRLYVPVNPMHPDGRYDGSFPVKAYFEAGERVAGLAQIGGSASFRFVRIVITGHFVTP